MKLFGGILTFFGVCLFAVAVRYLILSLAEEGHPVLNAFHVEGEIESRTVRKEELVLVEV